MLEYLKICRPDHWLKNVFIVFGHVVAWALALDFHLPPTLLGLAVLLLISGVVYNVPPLRLKDRAFLDVIAESFNNPIRLWLGYYALVDARHVPPLSIVLAWWSFGALLMTGKRYAEFRFIGCAVTSG